MPPSDDHDEWRFLREERAGIKEHSGGMSRRDAERQAKAEIATLWRGQVAREVLEMDLSVPA